MKWTILLLIVAFCGLIVSCSDEQEEQPRLSELLEVQVQEATEQGLFSRQDREQLNALVNHDPDSAITYFNIILDSIPSSVDVLGWRMAAYYNLQKYRECKMDLEALMTIDREEFSSVGWNGMLDYLDCKIQTGGDCGDSVSKGDGTNPYVYEVYIEMPEEDADTSKEILDSNIVKEYFPN